MVLARNYSDFTPARLREIYEGARLGLPSISHMLKVAQQACPRRSGREAA